MIRLAAHVAVAIWLATTAPGLADTVGLTQTDAGWQLVVDGEPFRIKGAGGGQYLDVLAKSGGNTIRTWGVGPDTTALLDKAHANGLKVVVGVWMEHERKGFDYNDVGEVAAQLERVREAVLAHKDHPALLAWAVGNEMEGFEAGDDAAIWSAVGVAAALVKELDGDHPTMTVIAEIGGGRVAAIHRLCPAIDIVGINSYAGAPSLPQRYPKAVPDGYAAKPYVVTEFGPAGTWETPMNAFDVPEEATSTQKAEAYERTYTALEADSDLCLGSFAFLWGAKREATSTWFGMFLADGDKVAAVDTMARLWGGELDNRVPTIEPLSAATQTGKAGETIELSTSVADPDGDDVAIEWSLEGEQAVYFTGGDPQPAMATFDALSDASSSGVTVTLPERPGVYRLYAIARDGRGGAATATVPLLVEDAPAPAGGQRK